MSRRIDWRAAAMVAVPLVLLWVALIGGSWLLLAALFGVAR